MALTYLQLAAASEDTTFRRRVKSATLTAAINIAVDNPAQAIDNRRDKMARLVLQDPDGAIARFALPVALGFAAKSAADLADATDGELDTRVAAVWNDLMAP